MFQKGRTKTSGRTKGSPNAKPIELRGIIHQFVRDNFDEAMNLWQSIEEPDKKLKLYLDLCAFVLPKLQAVQADINVNKVSDIEDDLRKLAKE
jgi:hypothetical protein